MGRCLHHNTFYNAQCEVLEEYKKRKEEPIKEKIKQTISLSIGNQNE